MSSLIPRLSLNGLNNQSGPSVISPRNEAQRILQGKPIGTYFIRESQASEMPKRIYVVFVNSASHIETHVFLKRTGSPCFIDGNTSYDSLEDILKAKNGIYITPVSESEVQNVLTMSPVKEQNPKSPRQVTSPKASLEGQVFSNCQLNTVINLLKDEKPGTYLIYRIGGKGLYWYLYKTQKSTIEKLVIHGGGPVSALAGYKYKILEDEGGSKADTTYQSIEDLFNDNSDRLKFRVAP